MWKLHHISIRTRTSGTQMWDLHIKMKLLQPHHLQSSNNPINQSLQENQQELENNLTDLENLYRQTCLKKREDVMVSNKHQETLLKFQRTKEELSWRNLAVSIDHKTKINSNFVLALSISYRPIHHMSEVNSPTNRNLNLTSTDLQLMNPIVPWPFMILMK